ncbi:MAG: YciI family protein [Vicinamibacterales bacterium]
MKFICLAYEEERILNELTPDAWQVLREETLNYVTSLRESGRLLDARPLQSATHAASVRVRGGRTSVTDGPFAETKEQLGGYFLIDVPTFEDALRVAEQWPSARFGTIEVRPIDEDLQPDVRYRPREAGSSTR